MSDDSVKPQPPPSEDSEHLIKSARNDFETAWKSGKQPEIDDYLDLKGADATPPIVRDLLVQLARVDLRYRWQVPEAEEEAAQSSDLLPSRPHLEDYVSRYPGMGTLHELPNHLIAAEYRARRKRGERPDHDEYLKRFPHASGLADILAAVDQQMEDVDRTTLDVDADQSPKSVKTVPTPSAPKSNSPAAMPEKIGRYLVQRRLGSGGFGDVYLARDEQLKRAVAIKVPHQRLVSQPEHAQSYLLEAQTLASLDHPHIVPIHDVGSTGEYPCFFVAKYIEGTNLGDRIKNGRLSYSVAARLVATVAKALHYAHTQGIVHRDVKPGNILLDDNDTPFVADFGLALRESELGKGPAYAGTPAYMSPEQARGEGHRVDGRSDIYSLGGVFYELLTGRRTFKAVSSAELLELTANQEARPPRQIDDRIPKELERICLKALAKRASDRYTAAVDMAEDLDHYLAEHPSGVAVSAPPHRVVATETPGSTRTQSDSGKERIRIVPKGLRAFDAHDADFFLELVPGPRDRNGLPDSIRFWKTRIEEMDAGNTFSVGLIYGPSGCGKSSLVQAGLLPRLSDNVIVVFVESTADDTETRLLRGLRKQCPALASDLDLRESVAALRQGHCIPDEKKILIVLDQFEQWLHVKNREENTELVQVLRQCDGGRVQCLLMVRDDFWMPVTEFMTQLEVKILSGHNSAGVSLFGPIHAQKVLAAFGQAYGRLPDDMNDLSIEEQLFLDEAVKGLAQDGKLVCVRLALFAEMMKEKPWTPDSLRDVGGTEGIGVTFLEETFSAKAAPPEHRFHQEAARAVLKSLLPESGTDIKGSMRSYDELLTGSGYAGKKKQFDDLLRILDKEVRLITPTDLVGVGADVGSSVATDPVRKYYQLTHDYLVPSLRVWLTRKQKETRRGRAELRLAERSAVWRARPENRHLPAVWEYLNIKLWTDRNRWTEPQRKMMRRSGLVYGMRSILAIILMLIIGRFLQQEYRELQTRQVAENVDVLRIREGLRARWLIDDLLNRFPDGMVKAELQDQFLDATTLQRRPVAFALAEYGDVRVDFLLEQVQKASGADVENFVLALSHSRDEGRSAIHAKARTCTEKNDWRYKTRLAVLALHLLGDTSIAAEMLRGKPDKNLVPQELPNSLETLRGQLEAIADMPVEQQSDPGVRLDRAIAHYYLDRIQDALRDLNGLITVPEMSSQAFLLRALCLARNGSRDEAAEAVIKLAEVAKYESSAASGRILTQAWLGDVEEANRQFEELWDHDTDGGVTQYIGACTAAQLAKINSETNPAEATRLKKRALGLLRQAYELGYRGYLGIDNDPDLAPLYDDPQFQALWHELAPPVRKRDPIERTIFIQEFPAWCGEIERLVGVLEETNDAHLRSGICLAIGSFDQPSAKARAAWQKTLTQWHNRAPDSGTHSAAAWALRQWSLPVPQEMVSEESAASCDWWHPSEDLVMLRIPQGHFGEGSGIRRRSIRVDEFWLSDREISVGLFRQFINDKEHATKHPSEIPSDWRGEDSRISLTREHPVQEVSWYDAVMFCNWLSRKVGRTVCYKKQGKELVGGRSGKTIECDAWFLVADADGYRLPTADEWEYACRAETTTYFACGDDADQLRDYAVYAANETKACGSKRCNAWGLFDMHGNVWEWCQDWYEMGSERVDRGGSWYSNAARSCQSASLISDPPMFRDYALGFRVACDSIGSPGRTESSGEAINDGG